MTNERVSNLIRRVTYKPGWSFSVKYAATSWDYGQLVITAQVRDSRGSQREITIQHQCIIPESMIELDEAYLLRWLQSCIMEVERHEMQEFLRLDGLLVDDPHRDEKSGVR